MATKKATARKKPIKRTSTSQNGAGSKTPTLVITIGAGCVLTNNQHLPTPYLSENPGGGFPNQVLFKADVAASVCLPPSVFAGATGKPIYIKPGGKSGPHKVKNTAPLGTILFAHSCDGDCKLQAGGGGDPIIIDN